MPIESTQHLYNLLGPQSWEEMRPYTNEKFIPAPSTPYSADRLTVIGLVWIKGNMIGVSAFEELLRSNIVELITKMYSM